MTLKLPVELQMQIGSALPLQGDVLGVAEEKAGFDRYQSFGLELSVVLGHPPIDKQA